MSELIKNWDWENWDWAKTTQEELDSVAEPIAKFFKTCTKAEIQEEAIKRKIQLYPVFNSEETTLNPQLESRGFWVSIEHDELNDNITYPGAFAKFSETPIEAWRRAPLIGEHNEEVYGKELGLSVQELVTLKTGGVI